VMSYDYSVLAGTQGHMNHRKTDRLLELVDRERLPWSYSPRAAAGAPATPTPPRWPAWTCRRSG
jgi:acetyl-CoA carboxylase carboxyltransferase component